MKYLFIHLNTLFLNFRISITPQSSIFMAHQGFFHGITASATISLYCTVVGQEDLLVYHRPLIMTDGLCFPS